VQIQEALDFVAENHQAVLVTYRSNGALQSSPVTVGVGQDKVVISSRETAYKVRNLRRDPRATLCVFTDNFYGKWLQIDGTVDLLSLPEAMEPLVEYYRRISGEHPDWDEYREVMQKEKRLLVRVTPERVGPTKAG